MCKAQANIMTIDETSSETMIESPEVEILIPCQRDLDEIAADILFQKDRAAQSFIEIGKLLIEAKEHLTRHGQWLQWLNVSVDISERMAQRYMQLARAFPNPTPMSDLGMTKLLALLTLPEDKRDDFVNSRHEIDGKQKIIGEMSTREVKKAIRKEMQWITPRRGRYDNIASELESAQQHLDTALRYMTSKKGDSAVKKQFFDSVRSINETAQKCLALIAVETSHASE